MGDADSGRCAPACEPLERGDARAPARSRRPAPADALAALFDACFDEVYALVRRALDDDAAAEATVSAAFSLARASFAALDSQRDRRAWLFGLAARQVRSSVRPPPRRGEREPAPSDALETALAALPLEARLIVLLRATAGFSIDAIAALLELEPTAVERAHDAALDELRGKLGERRGA